MHNIYFFVSFSLHENQRKCAQKLADILSLVEKSENTAGLSTFSDKLRSILLPPDLGLVMPLLSSGLGSLFDGVTPSVASIDINSTSSRKGKDSAKTAKQLVLETPLPPQRKPNSSNPSRSCNSGTLPSPDVFVVLEAMLQELSDSEEEPDVVENVPKASSPSIVTDAIVPISCLISATPLVRTRRHRRSESQPQFQTPVCPLNSRMTFFERTPLRTLLV